MKKIFYAFMLLLFCACAKNNAHTPMLWEISGKNMHRTSYIFGTFHTKDRKINQLNSSVYATLKHTQRVYTEIKLNKKNAKKIFSMSRLKKPVPLKNRLHYKTRKKLLLFLKQHTSRLTFNALAQYKTWAIAMMMNNENEKKVHKNRLFMDEMLRAYAKKKHIKTGGLESPKEQLVYFDRLSNAQQEQLLLSVINKLDNKAYENALIQWYNKGNPNGFLTIQKRFSSHTLKQKKLDKVLTQGLLIERNTRFARRIDILLQNVKKYRYFFAIGAGHLSGKKGVLQKLKVLGYTLKKID